MADTEMLGYILILEIEGEVITARALSEAMEIDVSAASQRLRMLVRTQMLINLGGDPVRYKSIQTTSA